MICSKILIAYDESDLSKNALQKVIEIAKTDKKIAVDVINVIDIPIIMGIDQFVAQSIADNFTKHGNEILAEATAQFKGLQNKIQTFLLEGKSASETILKHAEDNNCDLIVMGSRGLSGIREMLGSVSHVITQKAKVPVLIVK